MNTLSREQCAAKFQRFADVNCQGQSPLYEHLARRIAADPELLDLARTAPPGQPLPNLFLAAVHHLLLSGAEDALAGFYPTCHAQPRDAAEAFPAFRAFCLAHADAIQQRLRTRRVQTNEVRRCCYLLPAFADVAHRSAGQPLALIEIGASAGLNLLWDRYAYDYGPAGGAGDPASPVRIESTFHGEPPALGGLPTPAVAARIGIDLHPLDVCDPDAALWLRALVWPDELRRRALLDAAIGVFLADPATLVAGDGARLLPTILDTLPAGTLACVFHTHTLNQWTEPARAAFDALLAEASRRRPLVELSAEWIGTPETQLTRRDWHGGHATSTLLAEVHQHGAWIRWLAPR